MELTFFPLTKANAPLVRSWLAKPHVTEWFYGKGLASTLKGIDQFVEGEGSRFDLWLAYSDKQPFALLMTSKVTLPDDELARWCTTEGPAITLDLLIGEEAFLGKGLAAPLICEFLGSQFPHVEEVLIDPEIRNTRAIHAYQKAGFRPLGEFTPEEGTMKGIPRLMMHRRQKMDGRSAVFENVVETLKAIGGVAETDGVYRYGQGINLPHFNGTFVPGFQVPPLSEQHDRYFREKGISYCGWFDAECDPAPMLEAGFTYMGTLSGVALSMQGMTGQPKVSPGVSAREIGPGEVGHMAKLLAEICGVSDVKGLEAVLRAPSFVHYIGYLEGKAVGTLSLLRSGEVVGLHNGAVLPSAQNRGVATAMAQLALKQAAAIKARWAIAILMPDKQAGALCKRFGFEEVCQLILYHKAV
ncbi:MAG: GNAT family N-acetyltransferase [Parachlamydiales bacterium]